MRNCFIVKIMFVVKQNVIKCTQCTLNSFEKIALKRLHITQLLFGYPRKG
jgi:hypothetical protein